MPQTFWQRNPDMHQIRKGRQRYFGMKAHVGVDSRTRPIHALAATAANAAGSRLLPQLLHGGETGRGPIRPVVIAEWR